MSKPVAGWFEITGKDGPALQEFCSSFFGWEIVGAGPGYGLIAAGEKGIGGGIGANSDGEAGGLTSYVEVDDPAEFLEKAEKLAGRTVLPPAEIPEFGLTFSFFADPEGHVVGLSKGAIQ